MGLLRFVWRLPPLFAGALITTLLAGTPRPALAQSLSISMTGITRERPLRTDPTARFKVSRADCLANDVISFPLIVGNYAGTQLQVWATQSSDACTSDIARTSASATCWQIFSAVPNATTTTVKVRVQDFAARPLSPDGAPITDGINKGTDASCSSTNSTGQPITLWFMFLSGASQVGTAASWPTTVDLLGPAPPTVQSLGVGGRLLKLGWAANTDPDVLGYKVFCENLGSNPTGVITIYDAATLPESSGGSTTCPDAGTGTDPTDDAGDASDEAGGAATDATCTAPTSDGSTGGGTSTCGSALVPGKILTPEEMAQFSCGSAGKSATSATVTNLNNSERYAVAVVSSDLVENIGVLSSVQCGMPEPVNGFDEVYRNAGGTAGGASFCSLGLHSAAARAKLWPAAAFAVLVAVRRWRRRSHRTSIQ